MHRTTVAVSAALILGGLASCTSSSEPAPATTKTVTTTPKFSKAEITQQCVDAVAQRATTDESGEVASEPTPAPCAPLSDSEYLDAYMDGIHQINQTGGAGLDQ